MSKVCLFLLIVVLTLSLEAKKLASLPGVLKPIMISIDDDSLYISDQKTALVYSLNDFNLIRKIGRKGEGPGEFLLSPLIKVFKDEIILHSYAKFSRFRKNGELILEKKFYGNITSNICPIKDKYVVDIISHDKEGQPFKEINIVDKDLKKIRSLFRKQLNSIRKNNEIRLINPFVYFQYWSNKIFIADGYKGFYIEVFDLKGNSIYIIKKDYKKVMIPEEYKEKRKKHFLSKFSPHQKQVEKRFNFVFPEYFPFMQKMIISNNKIYIKTYVTKNDKYEYIILDAEGNLINKIFLPNNRMSTIYNNKFYFLKDNEEEESWEFHCIDIE